MRIVALALVWAIAVISGCGTPIAAFTPGGDGLGGLARQNIALTAQDPPPDEPAGLATPAVSTAPASQPASAPASQPASRPAYTAPSPAVQRAVLAAALAPFEPTPEIAGAGKEVSESVSLSAQGPLGRAGLAAPSTLIGSSVASRPDISRGQVVGLGFASPTNNIFVARANPLSGPNGRCAELAGSGFFTGDPTVCAANFRGPRTARRR